MNIGNSSHICWHLRDIRRLHRKPINIAHQGQGVGEDQGVDRIIGVVFKQLEFIKVPDVLPLAIKQGDGIFACDGCAGVDYEDRRIYRDGIDIGKEVHRCLIYIVKELHLDLSSSTGANIKT